MGMGTPIEQDRARRKEAVFASAYFTSFVLENPSPIWRSASFEGLQEVQAAREAFRAHFHEKPYVLEDTIRVIYTMATRLNLFLQERSEDAPRLIEALLLIGSELGGITDSASDFYKDVVTSMNVKNPLVQASPQRNEDFSRACTAVLYSVADLQYEEELRKKIIDFQSPTEREDPDLT